MSPLASRIIKAGLIVGTLDILSAFTYYFIMSGKSNVLIVLKYVASGFFGVRALTGGADMMLAGLLFHYFIAFTFTIVFFLIYPRIPALIKAPLLTGIVYGLIIWAIMNLIVVPQSNVNHRPFNLNNAIINALILIVMIGIPLSYMARAYFGRRI